MKYYYICAVVACISSLNWAYTIVEDEFKAVDYFEGLPDSNPINDIMRFHPNNLSFVNLAEYLFSNTKINYSTSLGSNLPTKCSNLYLEPSFNYHVLRPKNRQDGVLDFVNIKFPFSSVLASNALFLNKDYCIAFNLKNYGFGFDVMAGIPLMPDGSVGLHLKSISLSTENKLATGDLVYFILYIL